MNYTINDAMLVLLLTLKEIPEARESELSFTIMHVAKSLDVNYLDLFHSYRDWEAGNYIPQF